MTQTIEILVPDIGDFKNVPIIEVLAREGATIGKDETLVVLESDKATIDVPCPAAGTVRKLQVRLGDKVSMGSALILLETGGAEAPAPAQSAAVLPARTEPAPDAPAPTMPPAGSVPPLTSPSIRRIARELGVDIAKVRGTAPKGRIQLSDLQDYVKTTLAAKTAPAPTDAGAGLGLLPWPQVDFGKYGEIERVQLSKIRKISGANLTRNAIVIPHVTNFDEADITNLEEFRIGVNKSAKPDGAKLTMLAFMIKAAASSLRAHPHFNASLDGDELILKRYFHIGFAADTPNGLVVPVIRNADAKGLLEIAAEAGALAAQARDGKLRPADMQGSCFTVSSLGGVGGLGFTPIINAPEVAILGAARAKMTPVWDGKQFLPRLMMPVSLSWDHRVVDGVAAARFLASFTGLLADFRRVSL